MKVCCPTCERVLFVIGKNNQAVYARRGTVYQITSVMCCGNNLRYNEATETVEQRFEGRWAGVNNAYFVHNKDEAGVV